MMHVTWHWKVPGYEAHAIKYPTGDSISLCGVLINKTAMSRPPILWARCEKCEQARSGSKELFPIIDTRNLKYRKNIYKFNQDNDEEILKIITNLSIDECAYSLEVSAAFLSLASTLKGVMADKANKADKADERTAEIGISCLHSAAVLGCGKAQRLLGMAYMTGDFVSKSDSLGFKWLRQAALQDDPRAQAIISKCYAKGIGIPVDFELSIYWHERAVENLDSE